MFWAASGFLLLLLFVLYNLCVAKQHRRVVKRTVNHFKVEKMPKALFIDEVFAVQPSHIGNVGSTAHDALDVVLPEVYLFVEFVDVLLHRWEAADKII